MEYSLVRATTSIWRLLGKSSLICAIEESFLLKGYQRSIIDRVASGLGADMFAEGRAHSHGLTYKPSTSLSGSLAFRVLEVTRLDLLARSGRPTAVTVKGASLTT